MPEYLTKEEIRQWRSSLERITLEEYAARLGKVIQGAKATNDMIDKVMSHSLDTMTTTTYSAPSERLQTITLKSMFESKSTTKHINKETKEVKEVKEVKENTENNNKVKEVKPVKEKQTKVTEVKAEKPAEPVKAEVVEEVITSENITFKKPLIPREQMIFDYLLKNKGSIVYAKDMAALLELPRDYVYKYIKNLRQKINEDVLFNADNGGYVLKV